MESILIIVVIIVVGILVLWFVSADVTDQEFTATPADATERYNNIIKEHLDSLENFSSSLILTNQEFMVRSGILVDEVKKEICLWKFSYDGEKWEQKRLHYSDILSVEIIEDGITITKTKRVSQIGGALLGGILLGGVGAIIGGLSGKQETSSGKVKSLELKIIINNTSDPIFNILLLSKTSNGISTNDKKYKEAKAKADHWQAVFEAIIKQADIEEQQTQKSINIENASISDELKKLLELKELGVLTEDEFMQQKQKLLNR